LEQVTRGTNEVNVGPELSVFFTHDNEFMIDERCKGI
jgi:hypothetical protein